MANEIMRSQESSPHLKGSRNLWRDTIRAAACCFGAFVVFAVVILIGGSQIQKLLWSSSDFLVRQARQPTPPFQFAQVLIDPSSLNNLDQLPPEEIASSPTLATMAAGFPWSRSVYADAIERILGAGAKLIILDVLFPSERAGDEELRATLAKHPGRVILMANYLEDQAVDGGVVIRREDPSPSVVAPGTAVGFANFWRDEDGVVRSAPFRMKHLTGESLYSSPAVALGLLKGAAARDALPDSALFIPCLDGLAPDVRVPLWQIFSPREWAAQLKNGEVFRDRVVAIGAAAPQFHDEFQTPLGTYIGAGLHLAALGAAWDHRFYSSPGRGMLVLFAFSGCVATLLVWLLVKKTTFKIMLLVVLAAASVPIAVSVLNVFGWMPPLAIFLIGLTVSAAASISADLVAEGRERLRTRRALERYVSPGLTREILDHRAEFLQSLGGARREVTILFSDVRGFTARTEAGDPTEVFEQLNEYFGHMVEEILRAQGAIDKFLGDGILATWGTLGRVSPKEAAAAGIQCALAMRPALRSLNASRAERGLDAWQVGIGLHSGSVLFGNVGSQMRMEPTVIGDTVNLASRIEGLTKALGCDILVSESCRELAGEITAYRSADLVQVLGRRAPVHVFDLPPEMFSAENLSMHEDAIRLFRSAKFTDSLSLFETLCSLHPADKLSAIYRERCKTFLVSPPPSDWTGVFVAEKK